MCFTSENRAWYFRRARVGRSTIKAIFNKRGFQLVKVRWEFLFFTWNEGFDPWVSGCGDHMSSSFLRSKPSMSFWQSMWGYFTFLQIKKSTLWWLITMSWYVYWCHSNYHNISEYIIYLLHICIFHTYITPYNIQIYIFFYLFIYLIYIYIIYLYLYTYIYLCY